MSAEMFWANNILGLLSINNINKYIPSQKNTLNENLNAIVRLSIIIAIILSLYQGEIKYLSIILLSLIATFIIKKVYMEKGKYIENYQKNEQVVYPTVNNPFMNVLEDDYLERPDREIPKDILCDPNIKNEINQDFESGLVDIDVFGRSNSQRQYYTVPVTTIPNKQKNLANWLYNTPKTCKESNGLQCVGNNNYDLRQSSLFRNPLI